MFYKTVGRSCRNSQCSDKGHLREPAVLVCETCGAELAAERVLNPRRVALVAAVGLAVLGSGSFLLYQKCKRTALDYGTSFTKKVVDPAPSSLPSGTSHPPESSVELKIKDIQKRQEEIAKTADEVFLKATFKNGVGYASQKQYENALREFLMVEKANPQFPGLQMNLGVVHLRLGHVEKASACLASALQQAPNDPTTEYNTACLLAVTGRKQEALATLEAAIDHGFSDSTALKADSDLKPLRGDAHFNSLLRRLSRK